MLNRKSLEYLSDWYKRNDSRKPLLMRGARQVGKTTIVRMLAERMNAHLVELNMEKPWQFTSTLEKLDPRSTVEAIEFELNIDIDAENTIIFFDEVQSAPEVLPLLRYFYEETPEYRVIATGSLLEFVLAEPEFSIPVGRIELFHLGPLTFEEFLEASGESKALDMIRNVSPDQDLNDVVHNKLTRLFRTYATVGGMPEAVSRFVTNGSFREAEKIKSEIIETFRLDFNKYRGRTDPRLLTLVFDRLPQMAGRKVIFSHINSDYRSGELSKAVESLHMARIIHKIFKTSGNGVPLAAEKNEAFFKTILLDTGLFLTQLKINPVEIETADELNLVNEGTVAEQAVGQELASLQPFYSEPELYYWVREKKASSAEVDYLITDSKNRVVPVEVKAGSTGSLRSIQMMVFEKSLPLAVRFNSEKPSILKENRKTVKGEVNFTLVSLPHYLAGQVIRIQEEVISK